MSQSAIDLSSPSLFPTPGPRRGDAGGSITIFDGALTAVFQTDFEGVMVSNHLLSARLALALHQNADNPVGTVLVSTYAGFPAQIKAATLGQECELCLCQPVVAPDWVLRDWSSDLDRREMLQVVLVDALTNLVKAKRILILPPEFARRVKYALRAGIELGARALDAAAHDLDPNDTWANGVRWQLTVHSEEFERV
jgi:hypothetical protein